MIRNWQSVRRKSKSISEARGGVTFDPTFSVHRFGAFQAVPNPEPALRGIRHSSCEPLRHERFVQRPVAARHVTVVRKDQAILPHPVLVDHLEIDDWYEFVLLTVEAQQWRVQ